VEQRSAAFLATYRPLCGTAHGRAAVARYSIAPYVDGSCRREPDLECLFPTITALCRGGRFAPRLREGDRVAYVTKLGRYGTAAESHWRLTALLCVHKRFDSHSDAAEWFRNKGIPLPRNCMARKTAPVPLSQTDGIVKLQSGESVKLPSEEVIRRWDLAYAVRARRWGTVLACTPLFLELHSPPRITREDWMSGTEKRLERRRHHA